MTTGAHMNTEHVDVLIVGAGLSGVGAACHLQMEAPGKRWVILEARESMGGTWDLFRYPGIRSDSDMFTLGYNFRPWEEAKAIADGPSILRYIHDTAREHGVEGGIRFHHRVVGADWSSDDARWTVDVERTDTGERLQLTCSFLFSCGGYYRYDEGFTPHFEGVERFRGPVVHPQHWPEDLDYDGKRVFVIDSGTTAMTLVPAMAQRAAHVTMLQRSPTYVVSLPATDGLADRLRGRLPAMTAYRILRWKNVLRQQISYRISRRWPEFFKRVLRKGLEQSLPPGFDIDRHFTPAYNPWDQRLCLAPDGDLFAAIGTGRASIVTEHIETFTETGIRLRSGEELEADIIITATGLNLQLGGGFEFSVDGERVELPERVAYKGMMLSGVPNMAFAVGYTNASWTLKADLVSEYVCRLLNHMDAHGYTTCIPEAPPAGAPTEPFMDLKSGYVLRALDGLPKQGPAPPWRLYQSYARDVRMLRHGALDDAMRFEGRRPAPAEDERAAALAA